MKNKKIYISIGIIILFVCCLIFTYVFFIKTETLRFTWMPVPDGQEQIDIFVQMGYCSKGYVSDDNTYAEIEITEWQRKKWLNDLYAEMGRLIEEANEINHMRISVSADTKKVTVHANREVNLRTLATYLGIISWDIEMIQVINGDANWGFEFTVKDMETEKVLYTASCPEEKVKVYESFWDEIE